MRAKPIRQSSSPAQWLRLRGAICAVAACGIVLLLVSCATLLIVRRTTGALEQPLPPLWLIMVGAFLATTVIAVRRIALFADFSLLPVGLLRLLRWGPTLAVAMFGVALSIEGTELWALTIFLMLIVGAEVLAEVGFRVRETPGDKPDKQLSEKTQVSSNQPPSAVVITAHITEPVAAEEDENIWQQATRLHTASGEVISGWVKAEFQAGERTATLHLAFCPPLSITPSVQLEQISGPAARIKAAQVLPQGVRIEVRLNVPAVTEEAVTIEFAALEQTEEGDS